MRDRSVELQVRILGEVDYQTAWDLQDELVSARAAGTGPDTILLLTHPPVYTAGKRTRPQDRPTDGSPVIDIDRGGQITWHGPGQLVGYPIIALVEAIGVVGYVRMLEQVLINTCDDLGVAGAGRVEGRDGVWLPAGNGRPERKIAAIGARVTRGVTKHGFALNCDNSLAPFHRIVPCGISDAGVTSLSAELDRTVTVEQVLPIAREHLLAGVHGELTVTDRPVRPAVDRLTVGSGRMVRANR